MPHVIAEPCKGVKCAACVDVCPVDCIHPRKDEADYKAAEMLYIDPDVCIDCDMCVDECPVEAIFTVEDIPVEWRDYIRLNAEYFKK